MHVYCAGKKTQKVPQETAKHTLLCFFRVALQELGPLLALGTGNTFLENQQFLCNNLFKRVSCRVLL
jgi:hypothetical protein